MSGLDHYVRWLAEGRSFDDIRQDLISKGINESEIKLLMRSIDEIYMQKTLERENARLGFNWVLAGTVMTILGVVALITFFMVARSIIVLAIGVSATPSGMVAILQGNKIKSGRTRVFERQQKRKFGKKMNRP